MLFLYSYLSILCIKVMLLGYALVCLQLHVLNQQKNRKSKWNGLISHKNEDQMVFF